MSSKILIYLIFFYISSEDDLFCFCEAIIMFKFFIAFIAWKSPSFVPIISILFAFTLNYLLKFYRFKCKKINRWSLEIVIIFDLVCMIIFNIYQSKYIYFLFAVSNLSIIPSITSLSPKLLFHLSFLVFKTSNISFLFSFYLDIYNYANYEEIKLPLILLWNLVLHLFRYINSKLLHSNI